jgi:hypothetical protein
VRSCASLRGDQTAAARTPRVSERLFRRASARSRSICARRRRTRRVKPVRRVRLDIRGWRGAPTVVVLVPMCAPVRRAPQSPGARTRCERNRMYRATQEASTLAMPPSTQFWTFPRPVVDSTQSPGCPFRGICSHCPVSPTTGLADTARDSSFFCLAQVEIRILLAVSDRRRSTGASASLRECAAEVAAAPPIGG